MNKVEFTSIITDQKKDDDLKNFLTKKYLKIYFPEELKNITDIPHSTDSRVVKIIENPHSTIIIRKEEAILLIRIGGFLTNIDSSFFKEYEEHSITLNEDKINTIIRIENTCLPDELTN